MPRLRVVDAPVADLHAHDRNPRTISKARFAQLQRTMGAFPDLLDARPVIALPDGTVIAGNMRYLAAVALGRKTLPTVYADLDEDQVTQWLFLDNRSFGEDNEDVAAQLLAELEARGGNLDLTGIARPETDALLRRLLHREKDPDLVHALPETEPDSQPGTVYQLGAQHRVMCGDATNPEHVGELLAGAEPVVMASDPPYAVQLDNSWRDRAGINGRSGSAGGRGRGRPLPGHAHTSIAADDRCDWSAAYELVPSLAVAYLWVASAHACEVEAGLERIGFRVRQQIIWDKGRFALSRQHYHWEHEPCLYATREGARIPWHGSRNQSTVWRAASPKMVTVAAGGPEDAKLDHPTQKPVVLFQRPIENHLQPGEIVYDPFAGSGTAVIAAELTGTVCYAMEIDPRCCDLIRQRYEVFSNGR